ncbi:hypothetical protein EON68_00640 [archaeon]|nr:MAG: hypothetical protein EON68_00640 [archaeon]
MFAKIAAPVAAAGAVAYYANKQQAGVLSATRGSAVAASTPGPFGNPAVRAARARARARVLVRARLACRVRGLAALPQDMPPFHLRALCSTIGTTTPSA